MKPKRDLRIGIKISRDEREALDRLSAERDLPISIIIRQLLREAVQAHNASTARGTHDIQVHA